MIVVGAGPSGLLCAKEAASEGVKVEVWERKHMIGKPVQCTGLVSLKGLESLDVDYEPSILNKCRGTRIYSPKGQVIEVKKQRPVAAVLDRMHLDRIIAEEAESEGAKINLMKTWKGEVGDIVVGADGSNSSVLKHMTTRARNVLYGYQVTADLEREEDFVELHYGPWSPGLFAWIVPINDKQCRVGTAVSTGNPRHALAQFLHARDMDLEYDEEHGGVIPLFDNKPAVLSDKVALVGDAAGQVKASTGGGIAIGGYCGRILGQAIAANAPLRNYEKAWRMEFEKDLKLHSRLRNFFAKLGTADKEYFWQVAIEEGVPELAEKHGEMEHIGPLMNELMSRPALIMRLSKFAGLL